MNVRSLSHPIIPIDNLKTAEARNLKLDVSSEDRDADGRREQEEPSKDPLSDEELQKAQEYFAQLTGLNTNGLKLKIDTSGEFKVFLIVDSEGTIVRRILEWEMRSVIKDKDKKTGQLFDKSA